MKTGKARNCKVTVAPAKTGDKISYRSNNQDVASVTSKGRIQAESAGNARITVTIKRAGKKKSTWVKIKVTGESPDNSEKQPDQPTDSPDSEKQPDQENNPTDSPNSGNTDTSTVYMTKNIDSASLMKIYKALQWTPSGKVAVKLSTGEPPASNYLNQT